MDQLSNVNIIDIIIQDTEDQNLLKFFYDTMYHRYNPDINGYTFMFMVPPPLSGLTIDQDFSNKRVFGSGGDQKYTGNKSLATELNRISKFITFAAVDFTPPQEQINSERVSSRSGAIPFATEFTTSEQVSVTYIDDSELSIYKFHQVWIHYIWDIIEGKIKPHSDFIDPDRIIFSTNSGGIYGGIDYAASIYVVKFKPNLKDITYVGKCIGIFPQALPSKELIGQRTGNELTTLPFSYFCAAYRGYVTSEGVDSWVLQELKDLIFPGFEYKPN